MLVRRTSHEEPRFHYESRLRAPHSPSAIFTPEGAVTELSIHDGTRPCHVLGPSNCC